MGDNYARLVEENLKRLYDARPEDLAERVGGVQQGDAVLFPAFGAECRASRDGIFLNDHKQEGPVGILVSLYLQHARPEPMRLTPLIAFAELPGSMPYAAAFAANTQNALAAHAERIAEVRDRMIPRFQGEPAPEGTPGDAALVLRPLPKVALCYILHLADDEFPAAVTCLYSHNAARFLPTDGLADVGEYTSKALIDIISSG